MGLFESSIAGFYTVALSKDNLGKKYQIQMKSGKGLMEEEEEEEEEFGAKKDATSSANNSKGICIHLISMSFYMYLTNLDDPFSCLCYLKC